MSETYWKERAERLGKALQGAMEHAGSLKQRVRDAERRAERAERRRQEIDDEAYVYAEQAGKWQARTERMERERDEALASRPRVSESIRALPDRIRENYFAVLAGDERSDIRWPLYWANRLEHAIHEAEADDEPLENAREAVADRQCPYCKHGKEHCCAHIGELICTRPLGHKGPHVACGEETHEIARREDDHE